MPVDKLPDWLKHGDQMRETGIVPRRYLKHRTQRWASFANFKLGHTAALNMAIKTAMTNGTLMEVKKEALMERYGFGGQAYRLVHWN